MAFLLRSQINSIMNKVIIYAGRFHPFHKGHLASYNYLTKQFGEDSVYIATSNTQAPSTSPFSFEEKQKMMEVLGINPAKVVKVKSPYRAEEITGRFDPENTQLVFALSEKDIGRFQFTKKDGSPGYMQPMPANEGHMKPMVDHGYVTLTPTVNFKIAGKNLNSASAIRNAYIEADKKNRQRILTDLYGTAGKELKGLFDEKMSMAEQLGNLMITLRESVEDRYDENIRKLELALEIEKAAKRIEEADLDGHYLIKEPDNFKIVPAGGVGSHTPESIKVSLAGDLRYLVDAIKVENYESAYWMLYKGGTIRTKLEAAKEYTKYKRKLGKRPVKTGRRIDLDDKK